MKIKSVLAKGMSILLAAGMVVSFVPASTFAKTDPNYFDHGTDNKYGDNEKPGDTSQPVTVKAESEDVSVEGGAIECNSRDNAGLKADAGEGCTAEATVTGDINNGKGDGINANANGGDINITVNDGDVTSGRKGIDADAVGGDINITVNDGDVTGLYGIDSSARNNGSVSINIDGNVTGNSISGISSSTGNNGTTKLTVDGNVTVNGGDGSVGIDASNMGTENISINGDVSSKYDGIVTHNNDKSSINVTGSVNGGSHAGIKATAMNGKSEIKVGKDVKGGWFGIDVEAVDYEGYDDKEQIVHYDGKADITVNGTIEGGRVGVRVEGDVNDINVTAWAIEPVEVNGNQAVAGRLIDARYVVQDEEFEKTINYIIKVDDVSGATLSASASTAHETEKVYLNIATQAEYTVTGVYDNNGLYGQTALKKDDGGYYVEVPKGGGVLLTVTLEQNQPDPDPDPEPDPDPDPKPDPEPGPEPVNPPAPDGKKSSDEQNKDSNKSSDNTVNTDDYAVFNNSLVQMILNAAPGGNVKAMTTRWTGISKEVLAALKARPDVSLTITYAVNGALFKVTIPAGANVDLFRNASGGIDFVTLGNLFGATPV